MRPTLAPRLSPTHPPPDSGISTTLCALDTLLLRGYDVEAVVLLESDGSSLDNAAAIRRHLSPGITLYQLPSLPDGSPGSDVAWLEEGQASAQRLVAGLRASHARRLADLAGAPESALRRLWWPFTQHERVQRGDVTVMDGRCGDALLAHDAGKRALAPLLDACSSWWTQGVAAAEQPRLARAIGHAAARWGHVMFPESVHAPALRLAEQLIGLEGCEATSRVFYSDNGSTAVEVALKMALRLRAARAPPSAGSPPRRVLALTGSYHGDTLGAALAQAPSVFTAPRQAPWYTPKRGVFVDAPTCRVAQDGAWEVLLPPSLAGAGAPDELRFRLAAGLWDGASRDATQLAGQYRRAVEAALDAHSDALAGQPGGAGSVGACILEPAMQGAGGMQLVDPAFQRAMVQVCQARGLPCIFDEVFSGLWRLGAPTGAALLGLRPELICVGKLLTGGTLPLAATLASEEAFDSFRGLGSADALLHGHSYAGNAPGCAAAVHALAALGEKGRNHNMGDRGRLHPLWREELALEVARAPGVLRVTHLGTVFAAELSSLRGAERGYRSSAAREVVARLRLRGVYTRPLGDVVYLMVSPMVSPGVCDRLLQALLAELHARPDDHEPNAVDRPRVVV